MFCFFFWAWFLPDAQASCEENASFLKNGGYGVVDSSGNILEGCHLHQQFIPASTIKIVTAYAALKILTEEYRFTTLFFLDQEHNLYLKGFGDPLLLSEDVWEIATALKQQGITEVGNIFIDDSAYQLGGSLPPGSVSSENPYDAPVAATAVNFNSMAVQVDSAGNVQSGETQTPTLPFMLERAAGKKAGVYRLNICSVGCRPAVASARYTAELLGRILTQTGVSVTGSHGMSTVPEAAHLVFSYQNPRSLADILKNMLHYSSNFIANQLFLLCGAQRFGFPATWEKGVRAIDELLEIELGAQTLTEMNITDGAGWSRATTITVEAMLKILEIFSPYKALLRNHRGTLAKTGTMQDVYNYAGYFKDGSRYVVFLNQRKNYRFTILDRLKKKYR